MKNILKTNITDREWQMGKNDKTIDWIIMESNRYIHRINHKEEELNVSELISSMKYLGKLEYEIALEKNKLSYHLYKWDNINNYINR